MLLCCLKKVGSRETGEKSESQEVGKSGRRKSWESGDRRPEKNPEVLIVVLCKTKCLCTLQKIGRRKAHLKILKNKSEILCYYVV